TMIAPSIFASSYRSCGRNGASRRIPPEYRKESSFGSPTTMRAPSCERMTSSTACRRGWPGAIFSIAARRAASRRGSSSEGVRVNPSSPRRSALRSLVSFVGSVIEPRFDRLSQRLGLRDLQCATAGRAGRGDDEPHAELRAFLQPAVGLGGGTEAAGEADLPEGGARRADGRSLGGRGDRERDR